MSVNAGVRLFVKIPTDRSNPQSMKSYYKAPSLSGPILAHEYGHTGKASSIEDAVTFTHALQGKGKVPELSKESNNARDFKEGVRNGTHKDNFEDHGYFSTVRVNVWESYLASPTYRTAKRGKVTEAIFEAIAKECSALIHGGAPVSFHGKEKWLEMNERLMKAIDTEMTARGITKLK